MKLPAHLLSVSLLPSMLLIHNRVVICSVYSSFFVDPQNYKKTDKTV